MAISHFCISFLDLSILLAIGIFTLIGFLIRKSICVTLLYFILNLDYTLISLF